MPPHRGIRRRSAAHPSARRSGTSPQSDGAVSSTLHAAATCCQHVAIPRPAASARPPAWGRRRLAGGRARDRSRHPGAVLRPPWLRGPGWRHLCRALEHRELRAALRDRARPGIAGSHRHRGRRPHAPRCPQARPVSRRPLDGPGPSARPAPGRPLAPWRLAHGRSHRARAADPLHAAAPRASGCRVDDEPGTPREGHRGTRPAPPRHAPTGRRGPRPLEPLPGQAAPPRGGGALRGRPRALGGRGHRQIGAGRCGGPRAPEAPGHLPKGHLLGEVDLPVCSIRYGVEVDGPAHLEDGEPERDQRRDRRLGTLEWVIDRFSTDQVEDDLGGFVEAVLEGIAAAAARGVAPWPCDRCPC
jgi:hypothetical protein